MIHELVLGPDPLRPNGGVSATRRDVGSWGKTGKDQRHIGSDRKMQIMHRNTDRVECHFTEDDEYMPMCIMHMIGRGFSADWHRARVKIWKTIAFHGYKRDEGYKSIIYCLS